MSDVDPFAFIGLVTPPGPWPLPMTGERDTERQDRELVDIYGIEDKESR